MDGSGGVNSVTDGISMSITVANISDECCSRPTWSVHVPFSWRHVVSAVQSAITQSRSRHYWARTFYWTAPSADVGDIRFVYVTDICFLHAYLNSICCTHYYNYLFLQLAIVLMSYLLKWYFVLWSVMMTFQKPALIVWHFYSKVATGRLLGCSVSVYYATALRWCDMRKSSGRTCSLTSSLMMPPAASLAPWPMRYRRGRHSHQCCLAYSIAQLPCNVVTS